MSITVTLETAKKLKEYGRDKDCLGKRYIQDITGKEIKPAMTFPVFHLKIPEQYSLYFEAPTAEEILYELPSEIDGRFMSSHQLTMYKDKNNTYDVTYGNVIELTENKNLAEALAQLWIRCKENNYLDIKQN